MRRGKDCVCFLLILALAGMRTGALTQLPAPVGQKKPYVGYANEAKAAEFVIVGTSHSRCNSAKEVRSAIMEEQPDGVVVELNPERVIRLTKEYALTGKDQAYGADFLSAIETARELDIPLFHGDEDPQETVSRFFSTLLQVETYSPFNILSSLFSFSESKVDLLKTFIEDPMKLAPLAISFTPFALFLLFQQLGNSHLNIGGPSFYTEVVSSAVLSILVISKVYNALICDRDKVLASSAKNAARVIVSLKNQETIRKTWTFCADSPVGTTGTSSDDLIPIFTLKRPLEADAVRNLNLFEPRWLAMIDGLKDKESPQFGCVSCTNKFYSVIDVDGKEGRYADLIIRRKGRIASLLDMQEGSRPSGARKVYTKILGKQTFTLEKDESISVSDEGYLTMPKQMIEKQGGAAEDINDVDNGPVRILVVVGLLHANGVIDDINNSR